MLAVMDGANCKRSVAIHKTTDRNKSVANNRKTRQTGKASALPWIAVGAFKMNGVSLARNFLVRLRSLLPSDLRPYYQPFIYGLVGGLSAVAFQVLTQIVFRWLWIGPSRALGLAFIPVSLVVIISTALAAGFILTYISKEAAGSGIPQVKAAFWRDFGYLPFRVVLAKFFGGVITIGGGSSLGREGPTVHIGGAMASNVAGLFGAAKQERRSALLAGAAAGLAAAFNTPLSAITFVLEEIMEDLNSTRYLAPVLIASVASTFVAHLFLGDNPAFVIPGTARFSWKVYLFVIPVAALAGLIGVVFQKGALTWRDRIKQHRRIPLALKPAIGALINWICGIAVFLAIAHIGVFGLGYNDLQDMLAGHINGIQAVILVVAKLAATIAVYAWGGAGGIFSPTLFFGAAAGLALSQLFSLATHLPPNEQLALTVAGMSACLGAVVRAPITSILIVFEMTHQFAFVPLLMIGALASQAVSRAFCHTNFYSEILERDGIDLDQHIPIKSWAALQKRPIGTIATFKPITVNTTARQELLLIVEEHPYRFFPLVQGNKLEGLISRDSVLEGSEENVAPQPARTVSPNTPVKEAVNRMVTDSADLLVLVADQEGPPIGIVTLHDVLRAQAQITDQL
jgi:chloride channel protein, CIC family